MATGTVRFFNESKGFGLISPDLGGPAIFASSAHIATPGVKKLKARQRVQFEVHESETNGRSAISIRIVG